MQGDYLEMPLSDPGSLDACHISLDTYERAEDIGFAYFRIA